MRTLIFLLVALPLFAQLPVELMRKPSLNRSGLAAGVQAGSANLARYSEDFSNAAWTKSESAITAGWTVTESSATAAHIVVQVPTGTVAGAYTLTVIAKAGTRSWMSIGYMESAFVWTYAWFDLANGATGTVAAGSSATITALSDGWYKCTYTRTVASSIANVYIRMATGNNVESYAGDGASTLLLRSAQLNEGSATLPYVATTDLQSIASLPPGTATITRGANSGASTDDPTVSLAGWTFDSGDRVSGLPAKGAVWTTTNCSGTACHTVTSAGTKYINGAADGAAIEWDVGTVGGYVGLLTWWGRWDRVLGPGEELNNYRAHIRPRVNANIPNPWAADFAADFGRPILP